MSEEKNTPIRLWLKIVPLLILVSLFGWCSSNSRTAAQMGPVKTELQALFAEQGLVSGGNERTSLADVAKTLGEPTMNSLLYQAASSGSLDALKWLVAHGADPKNVGAQQDLTLLQKTALYPRLERLEFMLGFGLDPLERSHDGRSVLHVAAQGGLDSKVLELLLSKGLTVTDADNAGRMPMHFASVKSIGVLVAAGAEIDATDDAGMTALHQAAKQGRNDAVAELLRNSASVFAKDKKGRTPLHYAAMAQGSEAVIDSLLAGGAPVSVRDDEGLTPKELGLESRENSRYRNVLDKL
jgi:ankyrin repeat protein